jgi:hypothetical protein
VRIPKIIGGEVEKFQSPGIFSQPCAQATSGTLFIRASTLGLYSIYISPISSTPLQPLENQVEG